MNTTLKKMQNLVKKENLDCLLVSDIVHIRYLTGFSGSSAKVLVFPNKTIFMSDFRYQEQSAKEVKGAQVLIGQRDPFSDLPDVKELQKKNIKIGYESAFLTHNMVHKLIHMLPNVCWVPTLDLVESLTIVKTAEEIRLIKEAVKISDKAFERILGYIRPGLREIEVAAELEYQMKMLGSEKPAFDTIIASGVRSSMPHGVASNKVIKKGEFITMDFGAKYMGYHSDITRTVVLGKATSKQKRIYNLVLKAQKAGCAYVRAGLMGKQVDKKVRDIISKAGYGKYFGHGLGHGLGTLVHDGPSVAPSSEYVLQPNNVVTIEPGIYIPKWGGVRVEDDVVVKKNKSVILNKAPKELIEL